VTNSRAKGIRGELEWRDYLRAFGFAARRGQQYAGDPDAPDVVSDVPGVHFEVKRVERLSLHKAMEKAEEDCGDAVPVVAHRPNRKPWLVTMRAVDWIDLVRGTTDEA